LLCGISTHSSSSSPDAAAGRRIAHTLLSGAGGLRQRLALRGGSNPPASKFWNANPANDGMSDENDEDSESGSEHADGTVLVTVQNTCFGRSDVLNVTVDAGMLVKDLKRELFANFSSHMCEPEQMEIWWGGKEMKGLSHDSLENYGFGQQSALNNRLIIKHNFMFSKEFAGEATMQQQGGQSMGVGGQQAQLAAMQNAKMQALLQDPDELQKLMQSPEFQEILASNPEVSPFVFVGRCICVSAYLFVCMSVCVCACVFACACVHVTLSSQP